MNKHTLSLGCIFAAGVLLAGCQTNQMMRPAPTNGQIVKDVIVADQAEIAAAKLAKKKAVHRSVRQFANYLYTEHSHCLHKVMQFSHKSGIKPEDSQLASKIQKDSAEEMKMLETSSRQNFDKNYVNAMVNDHKEALAFLDDAIKHSTNPTLTKDLMEARKHVAKHLEKAEKLQHEMAY